MDGSATVTIVPSRIVISVPAQSTISASQRGSLTMGSPLSPPVRPGDTGAALPALGPSIRPAANGTVSPAPEVARPPSRYRHRLARTVITIGTVTDRSALRTI